MVCEQRLLKGEGPKTSWTRELTNDGELILVSPASFQPGARPLLPCGKRFGPLVVVSHLLMGLLGPDSGVPVSYSALVHVRKGVPSAWSSGNPPSGPSSSPGDLPGGWGAEDGPLGLCAYPPPKPWGLPG